MLSKIPEANSNNWLQNWFNLVLQNCIYKQVLSHCLGQNQKSLIPHSEQLPDAVVSESVPASREEELGA